MSPVADIPDLRPISATDNKQALAALQVDYPGQVDFIAAVRNIHTASHQGVPIPGDKVRDPPVTDIVAVPRASPRTAS